MSAMLVSLLFSATSMDVKAKTKTMQLRIIETQTFTGVSFRMTSSPASPSRAPSHE